MLESVVGEVLCCMDDRNGHPFLEPVINDLPPIARKILTADQLQGFIKYSKEILELAAVAEMVQQYRYPDNFSGFLEELLYRLSKARGDNGQPLWDVKMEALLHDWFEEELANSTQLRLGL